MAVRVGIIGAGYVGGIHARILAADRRVQIVGVADVVSQRAEDLAHKVNARAFTSDQALLESGIDAVYVTTPNTRHKTPVLAALAQGIHVFCEKPMATSLDDARQILEAAHQSQAIYQVGHNRRFAPVYRFAREQIEAGFVPLSANVKMNRGELKNPAWVADRAITGGFLYESTLHLLDLIRWLMGDVAEVICRAESNVYPELDDFSMILTFTSGHHCVFSSCAHSTWAFPFERIELYGEHAQIITEEMEKVSCTLGLDQETNGRNYFQLPVPEKWGYRDEDQSFITSILEGRPPIVTAEDGYKAVELVEAAYRSARTGAAVKLPLA